MSYLRGPITRVQIKPLMDPVRGKASATAADAVPATAASPPPVSAAATQSRRSVLHPEVTQYFIPVRSSSPSDSQLSYHPMLLGAAEVRYSDSKSVDMTQQLMLLSAITDGPVSVNWDQSSQLDLPVEDLEMEPQLDVLFTDVPGTAGKAKNYDAWRKDLASWIYRNQRLELLESPSLEIASNPGESERDFRIRLQQLAREQRDERIERLRQKYAPKITQLEEKKRRAEQALEREAEQSKSQQFQTAISFGATLLSSFMGRKAA